MTVVHEVGVRFRDLDTMGHVNNAIHATYLEEARVAYYRDVLGVDLAETGTAVVHLEIDYHRPIDLGDRVDVATEVSDLGESSITMEYEVEAGGDLAAAAETVQVPWDREAGEPEPIPEDWRAAIEEHEGL